ncbi:MAG: tryptophan--tRNA ligase [Alphaproteobacteria bacterium]|jgi:tryptophanyl-tRNA synthetase|nr:tryptophan--tRNA ligase [Alphaproteobacteria bacterium]
MKTVFSGIQPTGGIHLGNYVGAINNWVNLQSKDVKNIYCIVDLHAITVFQDPKELHQNILKAAAILIACGINPEESTLFVQSSNGDHAELAWLLNCVARIGWLNRMTQFKDKAGKNRENSSVGLYAYPNLMAADILLYNTDTVPVGEDQKQHIELARDIAIKFNNDYAETFKIPEPLIIKENARIMSLKDGTKKMSKSDPSDFSKISLEDRDEDIVSKIMKAKTDSMPFPSVGEDLSDRPEINNLLNIYSFSSKLSREEIISSYVGKSFVDFKKDLADRLVSIISPIRNKQIDLFKNQDYLLSILKKGSNQAQEISNKKLLEAKKAMGFVNL